MWRQNEREAVKSRRHRHRWKGAFYAHMRRVLPTDYGAGYNKRRQATIEAVFAHARTLVCCTRLTLGGVIRSHDTRLSVQLIGSSATRLMRSTT